jgi:hypothetical protein
VLTRSKCPPGPLVCLVRRAVQSIVFVLVEALVVGSFACASDPLAASQYTSGPASPTAPESPQHAPEQTVPPSAPAASTGQSSSASPVSADAGVVYTCPMHPEVQSNAPGRCAKCGMNLVPKTP